MDEYLKKYREQMDKIILSDAADQAILSDLQKADAQKGVKYVKRAKTNISAAMVAAAITIFFSVTIVACAAVHRIIIKSNKAESQIEGIGAMVDVGESYYYDFLAGDTGEIYVLTDNDCDGALTDHHAIAWKSTDRGDTWEEILSQPDELNEDSYLFAGDLREGEAGVEAIVIMDERNDKDADEHVERVYHVKTDSYVEYDMDEVYTLLGEQGHLWSVRFVNEHTIALAGAAGKCLLYDIDTEKVVKSLPYNATMGCLTTQDQFLLYGKEIYSCLDADSLEEQVPEEGLQIFIQMMFEENDNEVLPPMEAQGDTLICVTKAGIYEYKDGEITQVRQLSNAVNEGRAFNGVLPICKGQEDEYYVCTFGVTGMSLWQIDGNKEEMK